jgi:hypothetical protein
MLSQIYKTLHVKYPLFYQCQGNLNFSKDFRKNTQIPNFMKFRPVGSEMSHADGQKDMTKLILAFRNFANTPNTDETCLDWLTPYCYCCCCCWWWFWRNKRREDTNVSGWVPTANVLMDMDRNPAHLTSGSQPHHNITDRRSWTEVNPHSHVEQATAHSVLREVVDAPRL